MNNLKIVSHNSSFYKQSKNYNGRPQKAINSSTDAGLNFDIRTIKSYDNGLTCNDEQVLCSAGESFKDGCWEPSAIQLPSGEGKIIQLWGIIKIVGLVLFVPLWFKNLSIIFEPQRHK